MSNRGARPLARHCEAVNPPKADSRSNPRTDSGQAPESIEFIGDCFAEFTLSPSEIASVAFGNLAMTGGGGLAMTT